MGRTGRIGRRLRHLGSAVTPALLLLVASPLGAAPPTQLTSTFDEDSAINAALRVGYQRTLRRGTLKREYEGASASEIINVKELRFSQVRHQLDLRGEFTAFKALQVYLTLPIILQDIRNYDFAQNGGSPCGTPPERNCVTPANSTLVRDGLLDGAAMAPDQVAVAGPDGAPGGLLLPNRAGIDQIYLGLVGAPLSQRRDSSKPTWVIGFEARIAVGSPMQYDRSQPTANTSVGRGVHELMWWTAVSRRFRYLEPWMSFYYMLPQAKSDSLFARTSFGVSGQQRSGPQQRGGAEVGVEIIPWEQPQRHRRVTLEVSARMEGVFDGRGYSDVWELFANQPMLAGPCRPDPNSMDPARWNNGTYCSSPDGKIPFPGITNIESHAIYGGRPPRGVEITRYLRARLGLGLAHENSHFITFGDAGVAGGDMNINTTNQDCLAAGRNQICTTDERQVNPLYRPLIDGTGHRFRVDDTTMFDFFVSLHGQY
jgi:hypothetical protein